MVNADFQKKNKTKIKNKIVKQTNMVSSDLKISNFHQSLKSGCSTQLNKCLAIFFESKIGPMGKAFGCGTYQASLIRFGSDHNRWCFVKL